MKKQMARWIGLLAGVVFLGIGLWQGQAAEVWEKAVRVCLECIGIG